MMDFITRQLRKAVSDALEPVESAGTRVLDRVLGMAGIGTIAIACFIAAIAFLSLALYLWLAQLAGLIVAALGVAGFYLVITVICLLLLRGRSRKDITKEMPAATAAPAATAEASELSAGIDEAIAPFVAILHDAGLKREEVAVRLGTEVSKQFGPLALIAIALAAGFLFERSLNQTKKPQ
jgi:hypothetical protein